MTPEWIERIEERHERSMSINNIGVQAYRHDVKALLEHCQKLREANQEILNRWEYANSKIAEHTLPEGVKSNMESRFRSAVKFSQEALQHVPSVIKGER